MVKITDSKLLEMIFYNEQTFISVKDLINAGLWLAVSAVWACWSQWIYIQRPTFAIGVALVGLKWISPTLLSNFRGRGCNLNGVHETSKCVSQLLTTHVQHVVEYQNGVSHQ